MKALIARLSQPSTYAGLAGVALAFGVTDNQFQAYAAAAATIFSLVAVALNETNGSAPNA